LPRRPPEKSNVSPEERMSSRFRAPVLLTFVTTVCLNVSVIGLVAVTA